MRELSVPCVVKRSGTKSSTAEKMKLMEEHGAAIGVGRVVHSSLALAQTQPQNKLPNRTIPLVMSSDGTFQMKSGSFPGLEFLKRSPWSILSLKAMLIQWSVLLPQTKEKPEGHVDVCHPCCY
jgi:hypothetical protein